MSNLQDLISQRAALEAKIAELQSSARADAVAKVRALMAEHGLTAADISGKVSSTRAAGDPKMPSKVAAKYRNAATGESWTGRGLKPKWMTAALASGAKIEDFAI
jgi:DNA-binding protein H-NS